MAITCTSHALLSAPAAVLCLTRLLQLMLPSLLLSIVSETVVQFLLAQGEAVPGMVSSLIGLAVSPAYNFGLVWGIWGWQGLGLQGAGIAAVAIQGTLVTVLMTYLLYRCGEGAEAATLSLGCLQILNRLVDSSC
jgi:Na+-driven multidrug efflux pump